MMKEIKLIALDMDGTALTPENVFSEETIHAINEALNKGIEVLFASGRAVSEIVDFIRPFPKMRYAICGNGTNVHDFKEGKDLYIRPLPREVSDELMSLAEGKDIFIQACTGGKYRNSAWVLDRLPDFRMEKYEKLLRSASEAVPDIFSFYHDCPEPFTKINFYFTSLDERKKMMEELENRNLPITCVSGLNDNIEMTLEGLSKGEGLKALAESLSIPLEQTMGIGDNLNDEPLLKTCGLSVAMGNAVPGLKEITDAVTDDNSHDGVAKAIRRYALHEENNNA